MVQWNLLLVLIGYQAAVIAHELGDGNGRYAECGSGKVSQSLLLAGYYWRFARPTRMLQSINQS